MRKKEFPFNLLLLSWVLVGGVGSLLWSVVNGVMQGFTVPTVYGNQTYDGLNWAITQPIGWWLIASLFFGFGLLMIFVFRKWANYAQTGKDIT